MKRKRMSSSCMPALAVAITLLGATAQGQVTFTDVGSEASLVALWKLDEAAGAGTVLDVGGSYTGTVYGTPTLGATSAMSTLGTAAYFNGDSGNRISIPYAAALNPESYTIETWAQVKGGAGTYRSPITSRRSSPYEGYIFYAASNNNWEFWGGTGTGWATTGGPSVVQNQWVHLAATYDNGSGNRVFHINGHPVATRTATLTPNTGNPLNIGAGGDGGTSYQFNGTLDNVAVLNTALAHQSIANHYNAKSNYAMHVAADAPTAYWRLGEQAGTTAYNAVDVTKYAGTYANVTLRQADSVFADDIDTAASFANSAAKVTVDYNADLNPAGSFAVEAWARVDGSQGTYRTVLSSRGSSGGSHGFTIYANQTNQWEFRTGTGIDPAWTTIIGTGVAVNEWAHVAGVYDSASQTQRLYVNGAMVASASGIVYAPTTTNNLFIGMGGDSGTEFTFNGLIDEVALYGNTLSASTVNRRYLLGSNGAEFATWSGAGGNLLWSTLGNWTSAEGPAEKNIVFDNTAASATAGAITNTVDADLTVASLSFENTGDNYHTTSISAGNTLTIQSAADDGRIYVADAARINGRLAGSQGLIKTGAGMLTLGGATSSMTIGGSGVTVTEGTLQLNSVGLGFDVGLFAAGTAIRVEANGALEIAQSFNVKHSNVITVNGGTLNLTAGSANDSGNYINNLHLAGGTVTGNGIRVGYTLSDAIFTVTGNVGSTIANPIVLVNNVDQTGIRKLTLNVADGTAANDLIMSGTFSDYSGLTGTDVVKTGDGTLRLDGSLNYTGETIVDGGVLVLNKGGSLSPGNAGQFAAPGNTVTVNSGGTLRLAAGWAMGDGGQNHLIADGGTLDFSGSSNYQNNITLIGGAITGSAWRNGYYAGDALITIEESDVSSTISGQITFVKNASGGLGKTTFDVADGAVDDDLIVSASIVDLGGYTGRSLTKAGPGTMVLSGASTFIGGVAVDAGTLLVNNTAGSGTGTGAVNVSSGATLGGTGTIGGATTIAGGATLATGASVGTLGFGSSLTLVDGAVWDWEFLNNTAGSYDQAVGPTLVLPTDGSGTIGLNITAIDGYNLEAGDSFTLFTGDVYQGAELLDAGQNISDLFTISDNIGWWGTWEVTAGSLVLTAVPEPGT